jgi:hypothetical protein
LSNGLDSLIIRFISVRSAAAMSCRAWLALGHEPVEGRLRFRRVARLELVQHGIEESIPDGLVVHAGLPVA